MLRLISRRYRVACPCIAVLTCATPTVVCAQTATAPPATRRRPPASFSVPPTRADRPPYTTWTKHLCPATDAVVSVQTTLRRQNTGENVVQNGVGVLVRCDGLVLIPSSLLHLAADPNEPPGKNPTRVVEIAITLPEGLVEKGEALRVTVPEPRFATRPVPYVQVKIRDRHLRGVPLLSPRVLEEEGDRQVQILVPRDQGRSELTRIPGRVHRRGPGYELVPDNNASTTKLPAGAVVMDTASGMALGMIAPGWGTEPTLAAFTTFAHLHEITNAIGMVTLPDTRIADERADKLPVPGEKRDNMIWIPGGAVAVDPIDFPDGNGAIVACTPGYWIDETEVTVGEYRAFLKKTNYRPLPANWQEGDVLGGTDVRFQDDIPVHGVSASDAEAYARWAGKRLATPLEWQHAARGVGLAPMGNLPGFSHERTPNRYRYIGSHYRGQPIFGILSQGEPFPFLSLEGISTKSDPWQVAYEASVATTESRLRYGMLQILINETDETVNREVGPLPNQSRISVSRPGGKPDARTLRKPPTNSDPAFANFSDWNKMTPSQSVLSISLLDTLINADRQYIEAARFNVKNAIEVVNVGGYGYLWPPWLNQNTVHLAIGLNPDLAYRVIIHRHFIMEQLCGLFQDAFGCVAICPVGENTYDRSIFGVLDMGTGVPEYLQANQAYRKIEQWNKFLRPLFDPEVTPEWRDLWHQEIARRIAAFDVQLSGGDSFNYENVSSHVAWLPGTRKFHIARLYSQPSSLAQSSDVPATMGELNSYPVQLLPILPLAKMSEAPDLGVGFRCVR